VVAVAARVSSAGVSTGRLSGAVVSPRYRWLCSSLKSQRTFGRSAGIGPALQDRGIVVSSTHEARNRYPRTGGHVGVRILLIDIDSLRPDHLGCYGYARDTSPTIDRLASAGVRFDRCYVSDSPCLPSRTALATGRHGAKNGVVTHQGSGQWYREPGSGHSLDPDRPPSFRLLSDAGLHTASVSLFSRRHLAYHFAGTFDETIQPKAGSGTSLTASDVTPLAERWLDDHATEDDWLLHVNYWDVHTRYPSTYPDGELETIRNSGPGPDWPDSDAIERHLAVSGGCTATHLYHEHEGHVAESSDHPWDAPQSIRRPADLAPLVDRYDAQIRHTDRAVARLLDALEAAGVRDETTVVVTADHGEAFGEHGIYATHGFPDPAVQRVPLIISGPAVDSGAEGRTVNGHVYQFDLLPTLCERAGVDVPPGWDASPFTRALDDEAFAGRDHLVCSNGVLTYGRAVYRNDWAYIRLLHPGVYAFPGLYADGEFGLELLHDLDADPHCTRNLIHDRPDVAADLRATLDGTVAGWTTTPDTGGTDPLARMAVESGPFCYNDPEGIAQAYRDAGASESVIAPIETARGRGPGSGAARE
jgi:arylsulfatase A-like enzyme